MRLQSILEAAAEYRWRNRVARLERYSGQKGIFISFTAINKVGINPQSGYDTPIGIYAYPLAYVLKAVDEDNRRNILIPFAREMPYMQVLRVRDGARLLRFSKRQREIPKPPKGQTPVGIIPHEAELVAAAGANAKQANDARLFAYTGPIRCDNDLTWKFARALSGRRPVQWSRLLSRIGIDGCVDLGSSTIHPNEPVQAVFFRKDVVEHLETIINKIKYPLQHGQYHLNKNTVNSHPEYLRQSQATHHSELSEIIRSGDFSSPRTGLTQLSKEGFTDQRSRYSKEKGVWGNLELDLVRNKLRFYSKVAVLARRNGGAEWYASDLRTAVVIKMRETMGNIPPEYQAQAEQIIADFSPPPTSREKSAKLRATN